VTTAGTDRTLEEGGSEARFRILAARATTAGTDRTLEKDGSERD